eukprot:Selendium_serpulae@DN447_c0_g1_i4.p2
MGFGGGGGGGRVKRGPDRRRGGFTGSSRWKKIRKFEKRSNEEAEDLRESRPSTRNQRYLLVLGYVGTGWFGMQKQNTPTGDEAKPTIESELQRALLKTGYLKTVSGEPGGAFSWARAARTDKGAKCCLKFAARSAPSDKEPGCWN